MGEKVYSYFSISLLIHSINLLIKLCFYSYVCTGMHLCLDLWIKLEEIVNITHSNVCHGGEGINPRPHIPQRGREGPIPAIWPPHLGFGEGNGDPLHYSCLETPKDRGAVTKSQTWLKQLSTSEVNRTHCTLWVLNMMMKSETLSPTWKVCVSLLSIDYLSHQVKRLKGLVNIEWIRIEWMNVWVSEWMNTKFLHGAWMPRPSAERNLCGLQARRHVCFVILWGLCGGVVPRTAGPVRSPSCWDDRGCRGSG